jgi:hypothetical protein
MLVDGIAGMNEDAARLRLGFKLLRLLPRPRCSFLIMVDAGVAFKRKQDLPTLFDYTQRLSLYDDLGRRLGAVVLDGRETPEEIHRKVWRTLPSGLGTHPQQPLAQTVQAKT